MWVPLASARGKVAWPVLLSVWLPRAVLVAVSFRVTVPLGTPCALVTRTDTFAVVSY